MKANVKSLAKASIVLIILTVLPIIGQQLIPSEFIRAFAVMGGFDIVEFLNRLAVVGVMMSVLVLVRGHLNKETGNYLIVASVWKIFWLFIVFFALGIGHPETLGQTVLEGKTEATENIVTLDFRLFAILATIIVALMIARSIIIFQEAKPKVTIPPSSLENQQLKLSFEKLQRANERGEDALQNIKRNLGQTLQSSSETRDTLRQSLLIEFDKLINEKNQSISDLSALNVEKLSNRDKVSTLINKMLLTKEDIMKKRTEATITSQNFDQKANQLYNILSDLLKTEKELAASISKNIPA